MKEIIFTNEQAQRFYLILNQQKYPDLSSMRKVNSVFDILEPVIDEYENILAKIRAKFAKNVNFQEIEGKTRAILPKEFEEETSIEGKKKNKFVFERDSISFCAKLLETFSSSGEVQGRAMAKMIIEITDAIESGKILEKKPKK